MTTNATKASEKTPIEIHSKTVNSLTLISSAFGFESVSSLGLFYTVGTTGSSVVVAASS